MATDDIIPLREAATRCYGDPVLAELAPADGTAVDAGSTVVVTGRVNPVAPHEPSPR
ncbi:MAG: hypothetical protein H6736_21740 [Alphaproteobacteria bacterium]|nr:hypothetical protein [Alphaproteobacteria bacterium]